jgi:hypothetical protein
VFGRYTELQYDVMRCLDAWVPVVLPGLMVRNRRSPGAVPRGIGDRAGMSSRLMLLFSRLCPFGCLSPRLLPSSGPPASRDRARGCQDGGRDPAYLRPILQATLDGLQSSDEI